ncbi:cytoplasmic protein [Blastopirellula marina]|uniref:Cytoplasmic protein n=1 Tax=Blastopirellula marina TaxID=124 RepID=A0A2S8GMH1_9BACT|nr:cytoplasmic protein [Blastopirellula marina]
MLPILQEMVGAHRKFDPFYPNFPQQVMEASDAELYFNAMTHYFGFWLSDLMENPDFVVRPYFEKEARPLLKEFQNLRWIELGSEEDFDAIFTRLVSSNGSLSESDREIVKWFIENRDVVPLLPNEIPKKETLALLIAAMPDPACLIDRVKTATDVLRVAVAMSDGDISLAEPTKFRSFRKRERRFLLSCLERVGSSRTEDMLRWKDRWIRLGERLHPGDFKARFPHSLESFDTLRNDLPFRTFNSYVEVAIANSDTEATLETLRQRPGDFARRLDHLLRTDPNPGQILAAFIEVASKVSTTVLVQAWGHFHRRDASKGRAFFPKGNAAKVRFSEEPIPEMPDGLAEEAATKIRAILVQRFATLPSLGTVCIDERLVDQKIPFAQRSASRSLRAIARGSRFALPGGDTVRFFCWWKNMTPGEDERGRVDLDLSGSLFDANWGYHSDIAYYNLRAGECYHSGDITSAPHGACEFLDISLASVLKMGARYVVMSVMSYTGQTYIQLPECFGGWMMRQEPNSGEIFEPKTVQDKIDITAETCVCVPVIIDALNRHVYWADLALKSSNVIHNAANHSVGLTQIGRAIVELDKPTLHDLFSMHAEARGTIVTEPEQAETTFGLFEGTVTACQGDVILSEFLR